MWAETDVIRLFSINLVSFSLNVGQKNGCNQFLRFIFSGRYSYSPRMTWDVEYTNEFGDWWANPSVDQQEAFDSSVRLREARGPGLG